MVLILSILIASLVVVICSIFGRSWKFSLEMCWWRSKDTVAKSKRKDEDKYTAVSAPEILRLLNESQVFPLCWSRGWALRQCRNACQTWRRRHRNDVIHGCHVTGAATLVRASPKICVDHLRSLNHARDWDESILSHAYLQQAPPHRRQTTPTGREAPPPEWDIVRLTVKWAGLVGWAGLEWLKEAGWYKWVERKWCSNSAVYQRYWHEEEHGVYWLLKTCVDRVDWCFYLAQPSRDEDHCLLSVIRCRPDSWLSAAGSALVSHALTTQLQAFRTYIQMHNAQPREQICKFTIPNSGKKLLVSPKTKKLQQKSIERPSTLPVSKSLRVPLLTIENDGDSCSRGDNLTVNDTSFGAEVGQSLSEAAISTHVIVEDGVVSYQNSLEDVGAAGEDEVGRGKSEEGKSSEGKTTPERGRTPSPVIPPSPINGSSARSSPVRSCSTPKAGPRLTRAATLHEDFSACRDQKLNEWVDSTTVTQSENYSTQSLGLSVDSQYRTCSNHCAAQIITELTYASNIDLSVKADEQGKSSCGWVFSHTEKDVLVLKKHSKTSNSGIYSYIGKGIVQSSPRAVWEAVRNPHTRFTYDEAMKKMEILHDFGNGLKVVHMHHEVNSVFKKESRDFCVLHGEKMDGDRYILTMSSIDWLPCPVKSDTVRGQFLSSGWVVEPTFQDGRLSSMVTYLSQMNLKTTSSHFCDEIASKQPGAIAQLRQLLTPRVRRGSKTPTQIAPSVITSVASQNSNGKDTESGRSSS